MDLEIDEVLRRFLFHVVPAGFVRIRHLGLLANRRRTAALAQRSVLLAHPPPPVPPEFARTCCSALPASTFERCRGCQQGVLHLIAVLDPASAAWDTS